VDRVDATVGRIARPVPGGAYVRVGSKTILVRNALNVRPPPNAEVLVAQDPRTREWHLIGRRR